MNIGFSTCGYWASLQDLKEIEVEDRGNPWFDDRDLDIENTDGPPESIPTVIGPSEPPIMVVTPDAIACSHRPAESK